MSNVDAAQQSYAAFGRGDMETLKGMLSDDSVWVASDEVPGGGITNGPDEIIGAFEDLPNTWSTFEVSPEEFIDGGEWTIVRGMQTVGTAKGSVTAPFCHLMKFRDGKIVRGEFFSDSAKAKAIL